MKMEAGYLGLWSNSGVFAFTRWRLNCNYCNRELTTHFNWVLATAPQESLLKLPNYCICNVDKLDFMLVDAFRRGACYKCGFWFNRKMLRLRLHNRAG